MSTRTGFSCGLQYGHCCDIVLYDFGVGLCALYLHVSCMCCESKHIAFDACALCRPIILLQIIVLQYTHFVLLFRKNDGVSLHVVGTTMSSLFFNSIRVFLPV